MLQKFMHLVCATRQISGLCESQCGLVVAQNLQATKCDFQSFNQKRFFHVNTPRLKDTKQMEKRRAVLGANKRLNLVDSEKYSDLDERIMSNMFPTPDLPNRLFNGIPFKDLPIVHVKVSKNNTILSLQDKNVTRLMGSCGREGFKNTRKGTSIAAQAAGTSFAVKALKKGYKTIKVILKGLGPGRLSSVKGLETGGLNIVAITDRSRDSTSCRPKKQRRI